MCFIHHHLNSPKSPVFQDLNQMTSDQKDSLSVSVCFHGIMMPLILYCQGVIETVMTLKNN